MLPTKQFPDHIVELCKAIRNGEQVHGILADAFYDLALYTLSDHVRFNYWHQPNLEHCNTHCVILQIVINRRHLNYFKGTSKESIQHYDNCDLELKDYIIT